LIWGLILCLLAQPMARPMMGMGVFSANEEAMVQVDVDLPPHAVAAITLEFASERRDGSVRP